MIRRISRPVCGVRRNAELPGGFAINEIFGLPRLFRGGRLLLVRASRVRRNKNTAAEGNTARTFANKVLRCIIPSSRVAAARGCRARLSYAPHSIVELTRERNRVR